MIKASHSWCSYITGSTVTCCLGFIKIWLLLLSFFLYLLCCPTTRWDKLENPKDPDQKRTCLNTWVYHNIITMIFMNWNWKYVAFIPTMKPAIMCHTIIRVLLYTANVMNICLAVLLQVHYTRLMSQECLETYNKNIYGFCCPISENCSTLHSFRQSFLSDTESCWACTVLENP